MNSTNAIPRTAKQPIKHDAHLLFGGFGGKSDQLNAYNVFLGNPDYFDEDLDRYRQATPARLQAEAARALQPTRRLALSVVPQRRVELALEGSAPVSVA